MLAGRAHPAAMSAVAMFVVQQAVAALREPKYLKYHPFKDLAKALEQRFSPGDLDLLFNNIADPRNARLLTEVKVDFFVEIRDAILDNMASVLDNLPEDENRRAEITEILDELMEGVLATTGHLSGEVSQRIGNEIMID